MGVKFCGITGLQVTVFLGIVGCFFCFFLAGKLRCVFYYGILSNYILMYLFWQRGKVSGILLGTGMLLDTCFGGVLGVIYNPCAILRKVTRFSGMYWVDLGKWKWLTKKSRRRDKSF